LGKPTDILGVVKIMSENPRIYPFRRESVNVAAIKTSNSNISAKAISSLWEPILLCLSGFLLARAGILGDLYPFAPAFLAAVGVCYRKQGVFYLLPVLLGLSTVMWGQDLIVYSVICLILGIVFSLYPVDGKKQWILVPGMVLAAVLVSKGLSIALGGFNNYLLLVGIFESVFAAGLSLVFLVVFGAIRRFDISRRFSTDESICFFVAGVGIICGLSGLSIAGIEIQSVASRFLIIVAAYIAGSGAGAAIGAMVGIVPSLSTIIAPAMIANYAFSGMLSGLFRNFGRLGSILGFLLGNMILALYLLSGSEITSSLGASVVAAVIFFLIPKRVYKELQKAFSTTVLKSAREEKSERLLRISLRKLRNASVVFNELENSLTTMTAKEEMPSEEDNIKVVLNHLSRQLCAQCSMNNICWDLDYRHTCRGIVSLFKVVEDNGVATIKDVPENFRKRCPHLKELLAIVNCLYEMYCRSNYWQSQRQSSRLLISKQMAGVSQVLDNIAKEINSFGEEREVLERELQNAIAKRGLAVEGAGIGSICQRTLDVWVQFGQCPGELRCREAIEDEISRLLGREYAIHENCCGGINCNQRCSYHLLEKGAHRLSIGKVQLAKDGKGICGDSGGTMFLDDGRELLMISDGMGIGQKASLESSNAISLISRLLEAGFVEDTAIDTVNAALTFRGKDESFVTLDICLLDLYEGRAEFIKTGGAPSFIKHGGQVKVVKGSSLPVGMLYTVEKETINENIQPDDLIIMASDGLLDADCCKDTQWVSILVEQAPSSDPQELAEYLLDRVITASGGRLKDDITILVAKMEHVA